jgi:hypothetical protein
MKFYHAAGRFFTMKNDADKHRKAEGLPPSDLHTLVISNRDEICAFLNGLVDHHAPDAQASYPEISPHVRVPVEVVPDYVPTFLLSTEQKKIRSGG